MKTTNLLPKKTSPLQKCATPIARRATWANLTLPKEQVIQLKRLAATMALSKGGGAVAFVGDDAVQKGKAAQALARELGRKLYRVDGKVVSRYIGGTEKNLQALFADAAKSDAILFFDEADALFGKRTEVKDAHDRYANQEVSYLQQQLESHLVVVIVSTNKKSNIDPAFLRRLGAVVEFPLSKR